LLQCRLFSIGPGSAFFFGHVPLKSWTRICFLFD
jgi:hypothetical protein